MSKSIKDYMIIWTDDGRVGLQRWPAVGHLFDGVGENSRGACNAEIGKAGFAQRQAMVFIQAIHMIVRDKCDPALVHRVLSELEEYQDGCADDMPRIAKLRYSA